MGLGLVCVGAGSAERFGSDKLAEELAGRTVLERALAALVEAFPAAPLVVVLRPDRLEAWGGRLGVAFSEAGLVPGGARRQDSVRAGVEAVAAAGASVAVVHDAARPLVDPADVRATVAGVGEAAGAVLCAAVADTVKRVDAGGTVVATLPRSEIRLALTPQVVRIDAYREAWRQLGEGFETTDEAALLEAAGMVVRSVLARRPNPKLTTSADLELLRALVGRSP